MNIIILTKDCVYRFVVRDGVLLTILGVGRLWLVRLADYQHHITEYGLHANFFFTLAFVKVYSVVSSHPKPAFSAFYITTKLVQAYIKIHIHYLLQHYLI